MLQIHVNLCDTVQLLAGILQCNGGKLEEAEDFKCVFRHFVCVRIEIDQSFSCTKINHSSKTLVT